MYLKLANKPIKRMKKLIILISFLIITILSIIVFLIINNINNEKALNSTIIAERLSKISELSTVKYNYSNILSIKNSKKFNDYSIPFTEKSFLLKYSGYVKAGVDLKNLDVFIVKRRITITLKKARILDHVINNGDFFVYDEKSSMFNKLSMQDVVDEITNEKIKVETNLLKTDFLDTANSNVKLLLQNILSDMGFEGITIIFK